MILYISQFIKYLLLVYKIFDHNPLFKKHTDLYYKISLLISKNILNLNSLVFQLYSFVFKRIKLILKMILSFINCVNKFIFIEILLFDFFCCCFLLQLALFIIQNYGETKKDFGNCRFNFYFLVYLWLFFTIKIKFQSAYWRQSEI